MISPDTSGDTGHEATASLEETCRFPSRTLSTLYAGRHINPGKILETFVTFRKLFW
jgi:hypothetical protein